MNLDELWARVYDEIEVITDPDSYMTDSTDSTNQIMSHFLGYLKEQGIELEYQGEE